MFISTGEKEIWFYETDCVWRETKNNQNFKKLSSTIDVAILNPGKQPDFSFDTQNHPLLFYLTTLGELFAQLAVLRKGNFNTMIYSENQSSSIYGQVT